MLTGVWSWNVLSEAPVGLSKGWSERDGSGGIDVSATWTTPPVLVQANGPNSGSASRSKVAVSNATVPPGFPVRRGTFRVHRETFPVRHRMWRVPPDDRPPDRRPADGPLQGIWTCPPLESHCRLIE